MADQTTRGWSLAAKLDHYSIPEPNSGCLLWMGSSNAGGYGTLYWDGRTQLAHRLSLQKATGIVLPPEIKALHKCDVRPCIEPSHMFIGSQTDNVMDMVAKGRWRPHNLRGETAPNSRLTSAQVLAIRADQRPHADIAADYNISFQHVSKLKRGVAWRHL